MQTLYFVLADAILLLHALIVLFNVGALPVIWLGHFRDWRFVRNFAFRITHLLLIGFVAAESLLGAICPLTTWEDNLRIRAGVEGRYAGGYIAHWLHSLIFYDLDENVFAVGYGVFFALVLFTLFRVKPRPPKWWGGSREPRGL
jgi:uncharacterized protein DUF2784